MKRKFEKELITWKEKDICKPLMIVGARQIGKTFLINKFCEENFKEYIYLNLIDNKDVIEIFESNINTEKKINRLELYLNTKITEQTIIFIDEVQESEGLITALKYMCENRFPYKIICAGSLLGVKLKRFKSSFPVGKVTIKSMTPMDFEEFLLATNNEILINEIQKAYISNEPLFLQLHEKALELYRLYLCSGGMPESVKNLIDNNLDILLYNKSILESIISAYIADMKKYTLNFFETIKIEKIYNSIPAQLTKENKKFMFSVIDKNARSRDFETALDWLIASSLVSEAVMVNNMETPLKVYKVDSVFKLYLNDVGILVNLLDISFSNIILNQNFIYKGAIAENYVAEQLLANDISLYYWSKPQVAEIDFLIDTKDGIIPIEVKADDNIKSKSLNYYIAKNNPKYSIRISSKNFGFENNIKSVPLYAVFCINK